VEHLYVCMMLDAYHAIFWLIGGNVNMYVTL